MIEPISFKTSRRSFIINYIVGIGLLLYLLFSSFILALSPKLMYIFIMLILIFFFEPECVLLYRTYRIGEDDISEVKGVIAKKRVSIPSTSISHTVMRKGIIGRLFNFGDVAITSRSGEKDKITLKGIKHPEKAVELIEKIIKR